jgi:hypothetical protein
MPTATVYALFAAASLVAGTPNTGEEPGISVVAAKEHPTDGAARVRTIAETFVHERLAFWQKRLNLLDWRVTVVMTPRASLKPGTFGGIRWDKGKRTASMAVLDPADYRLPLAEMLKDLEFTVVHELIHLELASLPRSEASRRTEEFAVNNLTRALLSQGGDGK